MNCDKAGLLISADLDDELSSQEKLALREHLKGCAACRSQERALRSAWERLGTLEPIAPSSDFRARFWEKARTQESVGKWWERLFPGKLVPVAAGFLFVWALGLAGGIFVFRSSRDVALTPLQKAVGVFTAPFPPNSIEQHLHLVPADRRESI